MSRFPLMCDVRQHFDAPSVSDPAAEVRRQLVTLQMEDRLTSGQSVAITAGSRGIGTSARCNRAVAERGGT